MAKVGLCHDELGAFSGPWAYKDTTYDAEIGRLRVQLFELAQAVATLTDEVAALGARAARYAPPGNMA